MSHRLPTDSIKSLGFEWPKYSLITQYLVIEDDKVNLSVTLQRMESSRAFYQKQINEAFAFKQRTGADYSDFTDGFDDIARMHRELGRAISYLNEIVEAAENQAS